MPEKILVTGGSGFIGAALVIRLVKDGHDVTVLDNNSRGNLRRLNSVKNDICFIEGDIRNPDIVRSATKSQNTVFHLAYINGTKFFYEKPELILDIAVKGMVNVLDACIADKVPQLILASSSEVYQTPPTIPTDESAPLIVPDVLNPRYSYGGGKIISELMAINYGRRFFERTLIFRPHNVYGPDMGWEHVIPELCMRLYNLSKKETNFSIQGTGQEKRSFIYINDFIEGLMKVFNKGENLGIYHIGTQEEITMKELSLLIAENMGRQVQIMPGELRAGSALRRCPDISKIENLGFKPEWSIKEGLKETVSWYAQNANLAIN